METTDVLVAGAGPAGLSMGLFLNWHGIRATVVERHEGALLIIGRGLRVVDDI